MPEHLITCIVERGQADKVIDEAIEAGAQAATQFYARGRGLREKLGILGKFVLPEKEIILIVTKQEQTNRVFDAVIRAGQLTIAGKGFAYIQPVERSIGFVE